MIGEDHRKLNRPQEELPKIEEKEHVVKAVSQKSAYLNGDVNEMQFEEFVVLWQKVQLLRLQKSLYGLKQLAGVWKLKAVIAFGEVDDLLVATTSPEIMKVMSKHLSRHLQMEDLGEVSHYLEIQTETRGTLTSDVKFGLLCR